MKRTYEIRAEKVVYYRKEVVLDTDNWEQIDVLLAGICEQEYSCWAEVPAAIQRQVVEEFEWNLDCEDVPEDCYDTEEWCEGTQWSLFDEELEAAE